MQITILGSGSSNGTPSIEFGWGLSKPNNPKNRRLRPGIIISNNDKHILVDTGPDLREQLLSYHQNKTIDALIYTHPHADHLHGIDDVRSINRVNNAPLPCYLDKNTRARIKDSFPWSFIPITPESDGSIRWYKPCLEENIINDYDSRDILGLNFQFFPQDHGYSPSMGFRINNFAFTTDVKRLEDKAFDILQGVEHWLVGTVGYMERDTHINIETAIAWGERINAKNIWLTHISAEVDHDEVVANTPSNVQPVFDGFIINV